MDTSVGLRELRQDASELIRRVEKGERFVITVAGRASARLVPTRPAQWREWSDLDELFRGPADPEWERDRDLVDDGLRDPWSER
ncbi:type II toxin-antitoxin system Phd/YefM family antitoxin [Agilicoccus flavus]|uniref:type II toxin-antitoxin system Phd/YefM family antitoxin n=1 Tax=Agilicoccus flavus TaxID=2775968 RepID=UPI001CF716BA|nr:type II toxin-antitoxin system prevent-host-death family antitoxin [Agilicoccus flavus]